ncbi:MAG: glycosyltransferase [Planctomycetaceae bacterium]|nr:glycosyltransferase [Planctomycetaceae bacterium]
MTTAPTEQRKPDRTVPRVSIVIPVYNRPDLLADVLRGLTQQTCDVSEMQVLVCDDGSTDDLSPIVRQYSAQLPVQLLRQENSGPAAARNLGIRHAGADVVLFLDSDVLPDPDLVKSLLSGLQDHPDWAGAEARVVPVDGEPTPLWDAPVCESGGVYLTAAIAYRTGILRQVGGMDEAFKRAACEDVELAARVLPHGPIGFVPAASVRHPRRRKTLRMFWKKREDWRYVLYLALRHGFIGWPENQCAQPRLRLIWCALVTQPAGRLLSSLSLLRRQPVSGLQVAGHAVFSWLCGAAAVPTLLTASCPQLRDYTGLSRDNAAFVRKAA